MVRIGGKKNTMLTAPHIPCCNLHQLHEKHSREAVSRAKWEAVHASPASSQLLNWFLSVTSERLMAPFTARPWKSETLNTKLQQNNKSAPKKSVIIHSVKGLEAILGEGTTHTATVQVAQKVLPALRWGAQLHLSSHQPASPAAPWSALVARA